MLLLLLLSQSLQSCPTLCDRIDGSPLGFPIPGILQARTLEWVAISFSNAWKWKVKVKSLSCVRLFVTPWTAAYQTPPSTGFSRQEYWSGVPLPSPKQLTTSDYLRSKFGIHASISPEIHPDFYAMIWHGQDVCLRILQPTHESWIPLIM